MSDFDKEAEREKLREKYERDREKRQSTQVMSDLLLKGATMTNRHCDTCGDPIFRYDGQEFCPTCQRSEGDDGGSQELPEDTRETTTADERPTGAERSAVDASDRREMSPEQSGTAGGPAGDSSSNARDTSESVGDYPSDAVDSPPVEGGLSQAHDSLVRTVVKFSRAAESTDDPRRAREALSAAREAAETLDVLRR
ncbi:hypothetical protein AArcSl_0252 [Halalkaliarchaeum desulfuricum]|uniref:Sjogrens syndrome scleroderma autoantigen 1 n=1 Tax=Halalkaliarchaeum desulfuricum TaxID=2055893 RepID=A0A343TFN5_9EURY|nr:Sjogren's syndrome/scleroderma autoantigen 1 family protein [Halalkaliarchaeum desulfuricum]AUX07907.1 hypothetical protein AArcSl_0252 [Halalkaliarchaeum desulfuricum]